jgi:serine protease AprX
MRHHFDEAIRETRGSALWGKRGTGKRGSALWGKGGKLAAVAVLLAAVALAAPGAARADEPGATFVPEELLDAAVERPAEEFQVIVLGAPGTEASEIANELMVGPDGEQLGEVRRTFENVIDGVAVELTGEELIALALQDGLLSITPDRAVLADGHWGGGRRFGWWSRRSRAWSPRSGTGTAAPVEAPAPALVPAFAPSEVWPLAIGADTLWGSLDPLTGLLSARAAPAIAIVDSGVDPGRADDFGARVVARVDLRSGARPDDYGHGTMVAGFAAGSATTYPGVAPTARIVSIRVLDERGQARTSDVIAAADWLYRHGGDYGVRVANFSLHSAASNWGMHDPLNAAVRRLWLSGTVVVTPAGNSGPGRILNAPASDPFVITVGAVDVNGTADPADDTNAPWTSYGYTAEGFAKPEVGAPGRMMVGPVPEGSTLTQLFPDRVVAPGYMWMSGTSFSAAVVSGAAAQLLARHPEWTPDQVKGALMLTARPLSAAAPMSLGVGEIDVAAAAAVTDPPNPNEALNPFVRVHRAFGPVLDAASWARTARSDASWFRASWAAASWAKASWSAASWAGASWSASAFLDASWAKASWASASWAKDAYAESVEEGEPVPEEPSAGEESLDGDTSGEGGSDEPGEGEPGDGDSSDGDGQPAAGDSAQRAAPEGETDPAAGEGESTGR